MKKAADARYYEKNAAKVKERVRARELSLDPAALRASQRQAYANAREHRATKQRERSARIKLEVLLAYGGQCVCCSASYLSHLTLDHVDGGGELERRETKRTNIYRLAKREGFPDRFQLMCWNCNWAKHVLGRCGCQDEVSS